MNQPFDTTQDKQLLDYINQSRQAGKSDEQIRQELLGGGWQPDQIEKEFNAIEARDVDKSTHLNGKDVDRKLIYLSIIILPLLFYYFPPITFLVFLLFVALSVKRFLRYKKNLKKKTRNLAIIFLCIAMFAIGLNVYSNFSHGIVAISLLYIPGPCNGHMIIDVGVVGKSNYLYNNSYCFWERGRNCVGIIIDLGNASWCEF